MHERYALSLIRFLRKEVKIEPYLENMLKECNLEFLHNCENWLKKSPQDWKLVVTVDQALIIRVLSKVDNPELSTLATSLANQLAKNEYCQWKIWHEQVQQQNNTKEYDWRHIVHLKKFLENEEEKDSSFNLFCQEFKVRSNQFRGPGHNRRGWKGSLGKFDCNSILIQK
jgi:hypothetical protein